MDTFQERVASVQAATHAVIDLDAYADNVASMRRRLPGQVELMAVVKANAYGHGDVPCARAALQSGARWLAVARIEEGLRLRQAGITAPILVISPANPQLARAAIDAGLALGMGSFDLLATVSAAADSAGRAAKVHIKVETGLHRYGVDAADVPTMARMVVTDPNLEFEGLYTHFATADEADDRFLHMQTERFEAVWQALERIDLMPPYVHFSNSAAALRGALPGFAGDATVIARTGYALYGLSPSPDIAVPDDFRRVLMLKSRIARVFTLPPGEGISYGRSFIAERPIQCATLPIGYGDGLPRHLSNRGWALVRGAVCPIRGRIAMDQTVIDVDAIAGASEGDEVILYGHGNDGTMTVEDAADLCGTIGYEIVTTLSARLPRLFLRGGRPVAVSDLRGLLEADAER